MYPGFISRWTSAAESAYVRSVRKKHNSTRVDDGRELNSSRDRNARRFRRPIASDQADFFAHTMECVQPTLLVGCRAAARSPRALTGADCFYLESINHRNPIITSVMVFHMMTSAFQQARVLWPRFLTPNKYLHGTILEQARYKADRVRSSRFVCSHDGVCTVYAHGGLPCHRALSSCAHGY